MLMVLLCILSVIRHLWRQLELASGLNLIYETLDWGTKRLVDFYAEKTQLVSFDWSNNTGAIDVKMDGSIAEEKPFLICWG